MDRRADRPSSTRPTFSNRPVNADHPDVPDFIRCKADEEKKAWALIDAGYDGGFNVPGGAYDSVFYQNANHSVRVTDEFGRILTEMVEDWCFQIAVEIYEDDLSPIAQAAQAQVDEAGLELMRDESVVGTDKAITIADVAKAAYAPMGPLTDKFGVGLEASGSFSPQMKMSQPEKSVSNAVSRMPR